MIIAIGILLFIVSLHGATLYCCIIRAKKADEKERDFWEEWEDVNDIGRKW